MSFENNNKQKHLTNVIAVMGLLTAVLFVSVVVLIVGTIIM